MEIAYFLQSFYPVIGGMESYFLDLATYMARENNVRVYTSTARNADELRIVKLSGIHAKPSRVDYENIHIIRSNVTQFPFQINNQFSEKFTQNYREHQRSQGNISREISFVLNWGFSSGMAREALSDNSDIFHVSSLPFLHNHVETIFSKIRRKPCVFTPFFHHESDHQAHFHAIPFHFADRIIAVTNFERIKIEQLFHIPRDKIEVIPIPIDLKNYQINVPGGLFPELNDAEESPKILFLGRLTSNKGLNFVIKALKEIWRKGQPIKLILVGRPTPEWTAIQKSLGDFNRNIFHYQNISEEEKIHLLRTADMLVVPSIVESFGIVFLEAWTQKKPVIGAKGMPYNEFIIDGKTGYNVQFNNVPELTDKIMQLASDPALRNRLGENGFNLITTNFTPEITYPRIQKVYEELARR